MDNDLHDVTWIEKRLNTILKKYNASDSTDDDPLSVWISTMSDAMEEEEEREKELGVVRLSKNNKEIAFYLQDIETVAGYVKEYGELPDLKELGIEEYKRA